jgi:hypothetical protein
MQPTDVSEVLTASIFRATPIRLNGVVSVKSATFITRLFLRLLSSEHSLCLCPGARSTEQRLCFVEGGIKRFHLQPPQKIDVEPY